MEEVVPLLEKAVGWQFRGVIVGHAERGVRRAAKNLWRGVATPQDFHVLEHGVKYYLSPMEAGGTGLFLDQRENRRRLLEMAKGAKVLNLFAYTCGFSVAAAAGGAMETVSVDLSKRALERGRQNFNLNGFQSEAHRFYAEDVFHTLRWMEKKKERFEIVVIDPPSFSRGKSGGNFSVKRDFEHLLVATIPVLKSQGWLLASSNHAGWRSDDFLDAVTHAAEKTGRILEKMIWVPQGVDFPSTSSCPTYLKTVWMRLS